MKKTILIALVLALCMIVEVAYASDTNQAPIADAGLSRYAGVDAVILDGTGSYDPNESGPLSYSWQQISGPTVDISDANMATPTVGGFVQTEEIQECEFELVVSDGELTSLPDTVKVIIVSDFGTRTLEQENPPFNRDKPTVIIFLGGNCSHGHSGKSWNSSAWNSRANVIGFPNGYRPDGGVSESKLTYYNYGDMIIVYLSSVAPNYKQPIQTIGFSTGGMPAIDVAIHLNLAYKDARYAVNRMTALDYGCRWNSEDVDPYFDIYELFLTSAVAGEQCWIDDYYGSNKHFPYRDSLPVSLGLEHEPVLGWYRNSLTGNDMNSFNSGVVAGAYWSVIGPGKNLQLAPQTDAYYFRWDGDKQSGVMSIYDETLHPGRLPEPVTLVGPEDGAFVDVNGVLLSCEESENAVGYQLLFGPDPYRVMDYLTISDTPTPPVEVITTFPFEQTWWTVKVRDQYDSTIYADPILVNSENLDPPLFENITTSQRYASVRRAIDDALHGHEIVVSPGIYKDDINFQGKNLTLRSTDPNDSAIVAATVIEGYGNKSVVTFSGGEDANCVIAGFTITGGNAENGGGIYCVANSTPTITNCVITNNSATQNGGGIYTDNSSPTVLNCIINGNSSKFGAGMYTGSGNTTMINCTLADNTGFWAGGICNLTGSLVLTNCILWGNTDPEIGSIANATYSNIRGGWPGEGNIDADPLFADPDNGDYHLKSQAGRWDPNSQSWIQDDVTSLCIDAGDPISPVGFEQLPNGDIINMGAYGGTPEASKSP